jgi:hypothetical protein
MERLMDFELASGGAFRHDSVSVNGCAGRHCGASTHGDSKTTVKCGYCRTFRGHRDSATGGSGDLAPWHRGGECRRILSGDDTQVEDEDMQR